MGNENRIQLDNGILFLHSMFRNLLPKEEALILVDGTCGNGQDTLFLASLGTVYSFDIQGEALREAEKRLIQSGGNHGQVHFIHDGHENMGYYLQRANGVLFNLGYLPGSNKTITTKVETTIAGLKIALSIVVKGGLIGVVLYPGHDEGRREEEEIVHYLNTLSQREFIALKAEYCNRINHSPYSILIQKIQE